MKHAFIFPAKFIFALLILASCSLVVAGCEKDEPIAETEPEVEEPVVVAVDNHGPLYNYRYCEVLLAEFEGLSLGVDVYNSMSCNRCAQDLWSELDTDALQEETGALLAILNGPRYWVLDSMTGTVGSNNCEYGFGGIDMTLVASIPLNVGDLQNIGQEYTPQYVNRTTVFYFNADTQVYLLQSPTGECYVMQSYSRMDDPDLRLEDLELLGNRLDLPEGWSFKTTVLENDFQLPSENGVATVIQDNLSNTYQNIPGDCL